METLSNHGMLRNTKAHAATTITGYHFLTPPPRATTTSAAMPAAMDIDSAIDTRLPYRIGFPTLLSLPAVEEEVHISDHVPDPEKFFAEIRETLSELGVPVINRGICAVRQYHEDKSECKNVILSIDSIYEPNCHQTWIPAIKAIHVKLLSRSLPFAIEIRDTAMRNPPVEYPEPKLSDAEMREAVEELAPIVDEETAKHSCLTIDILPLHYSLIHHEFRPAFVICTPTSEDNLWWDVTLPSIRQRFAKTKHDFDVDLLYLKSLSLCRPGPHRTVVESFFLWPGTLGTSCALHDEDIESGTWGGKVVLKKDDKKLVLGLTCCHVLLGEILEAQRECKESAKFLGGNKGPFPPGIFTKDYMVVSPTLKDREAAVNILTAEITKLEGQLHKLDQMSMIPTLKRNKQNLIRTDVEARKGRLAIAGTFDAQMGHVYAASGYTKMKFKSSKTWPSCNDWALDWALFTLEVDLHHGHSLEPLMPWGSVDLDTTYKVTKTGRTTGKTSCLISGFQRIINTKMIRDVKGDKKIAVRDPSKENVDEYDDEPERGGRCLVHALLSPAPGIFALEMGDSGSLVLEERENSVPTVLGLAFARNNSTMVSYMMPAEVLVKSIEETTGGQVLGFIRE